MVPTSEIHVYVFDGFTLDVSRRSLSFGADEVVLGSRALDLLIALVEQAGEVLTREHLVSRVWPRTIVEDSSLRVHVAALRKALDTFATGQRYIANVPGRGYSFVGQVARRPRGLAAAPVAAAPLPPLTGREATLESVATMLRRCAVLSIVGPGGIGKTSVARHVLASAVTGFADGACWIDLSQVSAGGVLAHVSSALGYPGTGSIGLGSALRDTERLIVLDHCEHVLEAVALLAEAIAGGAPQVRLICTSREPLNVTAEQVLRLEPLAPVATAAQTLAQALRSPAAALFVERARAAADTVSFDDADVPDLRALCRQLDGLPLALELAAWRMPALGLKGLLARPDDLLLLLTRGRRGAHPRHQTLRAAIDWGHGLLDETERRALCGLAVFTAPFSLTSAAAVVDRMHGPGSVEEAVLRLVDKSIVLTCPASGDAHDGTCYRLLNTTRLHALERLATLPEAGAVHARHALEMQRLAGRRSAAAIEEATDIVDGSGM